MGFKVSDFGEGVRLTLLLSPELKAKNCDFPSG